jgi:hypothetical protein
VQPEIKRKVRQKCCCGTSVISSVPCFQSLLDFNDVITLIMVTMTAIRRLTNRNESDSDDDELDLKCPLKASVLKV